ncbi:uncharacterized protein LOC126660787 [Mercurialis annua]|uniref:uncharacterized protein LOC126660787 n=1 Tax=Mercurialis annua TaxID=3986 RepID=UPI002160C2EB|nr:uncharacterized protein LOC126660787 [Mercurialis annua]
MSFKLHLLSPITISQPRKFQTLTLTLTHLKTQTRCKKPNKITDSDLASDFATEVAKLNTQILQREEAMKKSKELLFTELTHYLDLDEDELKIKWSKLDPDEKWVLVKRFVDEWGVNFHPLSAKSVREMIEEYLIEEKKSLNGSEIFPGLKRLMGFSENK